MSTPQQVTVPPVVGRAFRAAPGLVNPHLQTLAGKLLRPRLGLPRERERIETPDGDFVDLDFVVRAAIEGEEDGRAPWEDRPYVVVLHGLEGSAARPYMMSIYRALMDAGLRPVGLNLRGCSGEPNRTLRSYHSGETGDLAMVLELLHRRHGGPLGVVGFSLGGNITLKLLGEIGDAPSPVAAAAAISVPFDLSAGADRISSGVMGRLYTHYFLRNLKRKMAGKHDLLGELCDPQAIARSRTIREFDDAATAPIHGFHGAEDYYRRSSSAAFLAAIRVPTLVVHALDDPFLPAANVPVAILEANPSITAVITERGGHVGFVGGTIRRPEWWMEGVVAEFVGRRIGIEDREEEEEEEEQEDQD